MSFVDPLDLALVERRYVSARSHPTIGIIVHAQGVPRNVDQGIVTAAMVNSASEEIFDRVATNPAVGVYEVTLTSSESAATGLYQIYWDYNLNGVAETDSTYLEIGYPAPTYDALPQQFRDVVEAVWLKFSDLFDSPLGGPHLQTYVQTNFGRERLAQLLRSSVGYLNAISQPHGSYTVDEVGGGLFPVEKWGGTLEQLLYIEVLKHLRRSYVEQPEVNGVTVARLDRRDYMTRWGEILTEELASLESMIDVFKMANMGLGNVHALVSGGVYGSFAPTRIAGSVAARPRYWARFY